jgi:hypothetical protein
MKQVNLLEPMAYRRFTDEEGTSWEVWEAHPALEQRRILADRRRLMRETPERRVKSQPRAYGKADQHTGWVVFRSPMQRRRLRPVPDGWDELDDDALRNLLRQTVVTGRRPRAIG